MDGSISPRMQSSSVRGGVRAALFSAAYVCAGCGATGLAWVDEAHLESARQQRVEVAHVSHSHREKSDSIPATAEQDASERRPRLNRTVTLGEMDVAVASAQAPAPAPAPAPGPSVNVYNYNQVNVVTPTFGYGNYGHFRPSPGFSPGRVSGNRSSSNTSGPLPGQSWPAVADHGPSFPYLAAPASPWTRTR